MCPRLAGNQVFERVVYFSIGREDETVECQLELQVQDMGMSTVTRRSNDQMLQQELGYVTVAMDLQSRWKS